jgi:hypothetical protein
MNRASSHRAGGRASIPANRRSTGRCALSRDPFRAMSSRKLTTRIAGELPMTSARTRLWARSRASSCMRTRARRTSRKFAAAKRTDSGGSYLVTVDVEIVPTSVSQQIGRTAAGSRGAHPQARISTPRRPVAAPACGCDSRCSAAACTRRQRERRRDADERDRRVQTQPRRLDQERHDR